jgi:hypothetical protein
VSPSESIVFGYRQVKAGESGKYCGKHTEGNNRIATPSLWDCDFQNIAVAKACDPAA